MSTQDIQPQEPFKILLIGDSCVDEYKIGTVDRLSPEAPVPVIKIVDTVQVPGMASNVHKNLVNLNCQITFITNPEVITKTRYIDKRSGQHLIRVDDEPNIRAWNGQINHPWGSFDAVVISDYNKGFLTYQHIEQIIRNFKGPVFIDTKKTDLERFQGAWVKINQLESTLLTSKCTGLIVTLGSKGAKLWDNYYPTKEVEVTDVCGCGDTFLAALAVQYLYTKDIEKSIMFANAAAGLTVQHRGNYAPSYDEIRRARY